MTQYMDMIVMGVRGYGVVKTLFMGSTTDRVVRGVALPGADGERPRGKGLSRTAPCSVFSFYDAIRNPAAITLRSSCPAPASASAPP